MCRSTHKHYLDTEQRSGKHKFYGFCKEMTENHTHNLLYSTEQRSGKHQFYGFCKDMTENHAHNLLYSTEQRNSKQQFHSFAMTWLKIKLTIFCTQHHYTISCPNTSIFSMFLQVILNTIFQLRTVKQDLDIYTSFTSKSDFLVFFAVSGLSPFGPTSSSPFGPTSSSFSSSLFSASGEGSSVFLRCSLITSG